MSADDRFAGSIPEIYNRLLVPLLFEPYARDLAGRLATASPARVLETAAGTGAVTRAIASALGPDARIVATDLNQPMIDFARMEQTHDTRIVWRQADAQTLPFEDESFDAVVCQFGAMFFPDRVKAFREAHRVLKVGGRYIFNVWDEIAANEFADVVTTALATVFPQDPPRFLARTPHGHHDGKLIRSQLAHAGLVDVSIDAVEARSRASSALEAAIAYCQGTPLRNEIEARDGSRLQEATTRAAEALAARFGTGAIDGRMRAYVFTARRGSS